MDHYKHITIDERETIFLMRQITSLIRTSPESFNGSLLMMYF
ncbi:hypothetical protein S101174_00010 (plasmid) [Levilactobacillus brevis]|nr:hypothetical protein S101174_00010 [Levilactobacillus brevis]